MVVKQHGQVGNAGHRTLPDSILEELELANMK